MRWLRTLGAWLVLVPAAAWPGEPYTLLKPGDRPPALEIRTLDGPALKWDDLKGNAVVLDFWATWCPPCVKSIPHLNAFVEEFAGKPVRFVSVTYEKDETVRPFLAKHPLRTVVGLDEGCSMFRSFKAWGIPMVVLVGPDGLVKGVVHAEDLSTGIVRQVMEGETPLVRQANPYKDPKGAEEYFCGAAAGRTGPR
jgi:thiol-disulfide isomerase/thioredoxin